MITLQGCTSSHTLSPLIALYTSCTSATFKRKPGEGVGHDLTNQQVSSPGLSPIRVPSARRSGRGVAHGPKRCEQGSQAHQPGATWYTVPLVPSLYQAHLAGCHLVDYYHYLQPPETNCNSWTETKLANKSEGHLSI